MDGGSKVGRYGTKVGCEAPEWYGGEVEMMPFGSTTGLCWMMGALEKARVMLRLEDEEMLMALASEVGGGVEGHCIRTRMVSCRLGICYRVCSCWTPRLLSGWCGSVCLSALLRIVICFLGTS
jgi:hypothetical protein